VTIIGHTLGGIFGYVIAAHQPPTVGQIVTLGLAQQWRSVFDQLVALGFANARSGTADLRDCAVSVPLPVVIISKILYSDTKPSCVPSRS
jgi:hypothetical protein